MASRLRPLSSMRILFLLALLLGTCGITAGAVLGLTSVSLGIPLLAMALYVAVGLALGHGREHTTYFPDTVYYLGFLFTLIALLGALLMLARQGEGARVQTVLTHFGIALITTIVGLTVRMWLTSAYAAPEESLLRAQRELEEATGKFRSTINRLSTDLTGQLLSIPKSVESLNRSLDKAARDASERVSSSIQQATDRADTELAESARSGTRILQQQLEGLSQDLHATGEQLRERLESSFETVRASIDSIRLPEDYLTSRLEPAANALARSSRRIDKALETIEGRLSDLGEKLGNATEALAESAAAASRINESLSRIIAGTEQAAETGEIVKRLNEQAAQLGDIITGMEGAGERLVKALHRTAGQVRLFGKETREQTDSIASLLASIEDAAQQGTAAVSRIHRETISAVRTMRTLLDGEVDH